MPASPSGDRPAVAPRLAIGAGWTAPALLALAFVALIDVPAHGARLDWDGLIAVVAMMYVLALSVAIPRTIRGSLLRAGGSLGPIVLLGRGSDASTSTWVAPRSRGAAIVASDAVSGAIAALALALSSGEQAIGYPHAIATLAFGVNAALAARALVPIPGLDGWALLLALIDDRRPGDRRRILRAARAAKRLSTPATLLVWAIGLVLGQPVFAVLGILLGVLVWTQADLSESRDIVDAFLEQHTADDIARPMTAFVRAGDPIQPLLASLPVVWMVVGAPGELLGFIGPRQLVRALAMIEQPVAYRDAMTPIETTPVLPPDAPGTALLAPIVRNGFAVVRMAEGLGYVEAGELARQANLTVPLGNRRSDAFASTSPRSAEGGDGGGDGRDLLAP